MKLQLRALHLHELSKLCHEVKFYSYKEKLGRLASPIRMAITRLFQLSRINDKIKGVTETFRH